MIVESHCMKGLDDHKSAGIKKALKNCIDKFTEDQLDQAAKNIESEVKTLR